ncbi:hypothetical protein AA313_de0200600 [Arthrobotrys entomopaga]|nr:hypothetical protein AA313_de0200600 [Arthrobotrys entomopaga]
MKGVQGLVAAASLLTGCIVLAVSVPMPVAQTDSVFLSAPVEHVNGKSIWSNTVLATNAAFNASDLRAHAHHTDFIKVRNPTKIGPRAAGPTSYTSREGKFSKDMLSITNQLRAIHGAPPVKWNKTLATYASRAGRKCVFQHSGGPYGENLAGGGPMNNPVWYQWYLYTEVRNYNWDNPGFAENTGHFTQLVWKSTKEMGCAWIAGCPNLSYMVWCEFTPPGNVSPVINYVNNVGKPKSGIPKAPPTYDSWYH